jgi:hypothetical protein
MAASMLGVSSSGWAPTSMMWSLSQIESMPHASALSINSKTVAALGVPSRQPPKPMPNLMVSMVRTPTR